LKNQQYPEEIVEHGIQKALEKGPIHTELREQVHVTSNQNNIIPFVATYNPRDYNLSSRSRVSLNFSVFVIVIILEAKLNGMFILICFG
jgi:hypothetical protein